MAVFQSKQMFSVFALLILALPAVAAQTGTSADVYAVAFGFAKNAKMPSFPATKDLGIAPIVLEISSAQFLQGRLGSFETSSFASSTNFNPIGAAVSISDQKVTISGAAGTTLQCVKGKGGSFTASVKTVSGSSTVRVKISNLGTIFSSGYTEVVCFGTRQDVAADYRVSTEYNKVALTVSPSAASIAAAKAPSLSTKTIKLEPQEIDPENPKIVFKAINQRGTAVPVDTDTFNGALFAILVSSEGEKLFGQLATSGPITTDPREAGRRVVESAGSGVPFDPATGVSSASFVKFHLLSNHLPGLIAAHNKLDSETKEITGYAMKKDVNFLSAGAVKEEIFEQQYSLSSLQGLKETFIASDGKIQVQLCGYMMWVGSSDRRNPTVYCTNFVPMTIKGWETPEAPAAPEAPQPEDAPFRGKIRCSLATLVMAKGDNPKFTRVVTEHVRDIEDGNGKFTATIKENQIGPLDNPGSASMTLVCEKVEGEGKAVYEVSSDAPLNSKIKDCTASCDIKDVKQTTNGRFEGCSLKCTLIAPPVEAKKKKQPDKLLTGKISCLLSKLKAGEVSVSVTEHKPFKETLSEDKRKVEGAVKGKLTPNDVIASIAGEVLCMSEDKTSKIKYVSFDLVGLKKGVVYEVSCGVSCDFDKVTADVFASSAPACSLSCSATPEGEAKKPEPKPEEVKTLSPNVITLDVSGLVKGDKMDCKADTSDAAITKLTCTKPINALILKNAVSFAITNKVGGEPQLQIEKKTGPECFDVKVVSSEKLEDFAGGKIANDEVKELLLVSNGKISDNCLKPSVKEGKVSFEPPQSMSVLISSTLPATGKQLEINFILDYDKSLDEFAIITSPTVGSTVNLRGTANKFEEPFVVVNNLPHELSMLRVGLPVTTGLKFDKRFAVKNYFPLTVETDGKQKTTLELMAIGGYQLTGKPKIGEITFDVAKENTFKYDFVGKVKAKNVKITGFLDCSGVDYCTETQKASAIKLAQEKIDPVGKKYFASLDPVFENNGAPTTLVAYLPVRLAGSGGGITQQVVHFGSARAGLVADEEIGDSNGFTYRELSENGKDFVLVDWSKTQEVLNLFILNKRNVVTKLYSNNIKNNKLAPKFENDVGDPRHFNVLVSDKAASEYAGADGEKIVDSAGKKYSLESGKAFDFVFLFGEKQPEVAHDSLARTRAKLPGLPLSSDADEKKQLHVWIDYNDLGASAARAEKVFNFLMGKEVEGITAGTDEDKPNTLFVDKITTVEALSPNVIVGTKAKTAPEAPELPVVAKPKAKCTLSEVKVKVKGTETVAGKATLPSSTFDETELGDKTTTLTSKDFTAAVDKSDNDQLIQINGKVSCSVDQEAAKEVAAKIFEESKKSKAKREFTCNAKCTFDKKTFKNCEIKCEMTKEEVEQKAEPQAKTATCTITATIEKPAGVNAFGDFEKKNFDVKEKENTRVEFESQKRDIASNAEEQQVKVTGKVECKVGEEKAQTATITDFKDTLAANKKGELTCKPACEFKGLTLDKCELGCKLEPKAGEKKKPAEPKAGELTCKVTVKFGRLVNLKLFEKVEVENSDLPAFKFDIGSITSTVNVVPGRTVVFVGVPRKSGSMLTADGLKGEYTCKNAKQKVVASEKFAQPYIKLIKIAKNTKVSCDFTFSGRSGSVDNCRAS